MPLAPARSPRLVSTVLLALILALVPETSSLAQSTDVDAVVPPGDPAVERLVEAESLVPAAAASAPVEQQGPCCGVVWSGEPPAADQVLLRAEGAGDAVTLAFEVDDPGTYRLGADLTRGPDYGVIDLAVDGQPVRSGFDAYATATEVVRRVDLGTLDLTAGTHQLTLTVTDANAASSGFLAGLDLIRLRALPTEGRLLLTPRDGQLVTGLLPTYGWSIDAQDTLELAVDDTTVSSRDALADSATFVYEATGIQAGPAGADFAVGIEVLGQRILVGHDVDDYDTDSHDIPGELLAEGINEITVFTGPDPARGPNSNFDNFRVRNVRLVLADGTVLTDPTKTDDYYPVNDGDPTETFTFEIPPASATPPARGYVWDTTTVPDGKHQVALTADGPAGHETRSATVTVDNTAPQILSTTPTEGQKVKGEVMFDAEARDPGGRPVEVTATLDGEPFELPATVSSDELLEGDHEFVVTATDAVGLSTTRTIAFTSVPQQPEVPQVVRPTSGADDVSRTPELVVTASDPDDDPLEVTFLQALPARDGPASGSAGETAVEPPAQLNPDGGATLTKHNLRAVAASDDVRLDAAKSEEFPYQRFDVELPRKLTGDAVDVSWEGTVSPDREIVLSTWDVTDQAWVEVAAGRGDGDGDTTIVGTVPLADTRDGDVIHLLVQGRDPFVPPASDEPDGAFEDPSAYDFSIAWMTDTQYLSEGQAAGREQFGQAYRAINDWIVANADERKIAYVAHTGDIINSWTRNTTDPTVSRQEFAFARETMDVLADARVPFGVTPGNHDSRRGLTYDLYNEYFPPNYFEEAAAAAPTGADGEDYYGGSWKPGDNQNHYDLVEAGGERLIFVYLGWLVGQDEIDWANQVLREHADRKAVFLTHAYLRPSTAPDGSGAGFAAQGQELFDQVILPNDNVFLTLSGHTHGVAMNIKRDVGVEGRTVVEMLANYQFYRVDDERRTGFFRLLQFDTDDATLSVNTYSPVLDDHNADEYDTANDRDYTPAADEFVVPVDLAGRTTTFATDTVGVTVRTDRVIGTDVIASGTEASIVWGDNLKPGRTYGWYAVATDEFGAHATSPVWYFTTEGHQPGPPPGRPRNR